VPTAVLTENPAKDVCRYLKHWTSARLVEESLSQRHVGLTQDRRRKAARSAALSILQGLEFLEGALAATSLTRPLPLFYAAENIVKGVALISDPSLDLHDFRAHGLRGDKSRRYSVKNLTCHIQRPGSDVWSRAHRLLNADWVKFSITSDGQGLTRSWRSPARAGSRTGAEVSFGELVRQLPELAGDVSTAGWSHPYVVHVPVFEYTVSTTVPTASLRFLLRHGHNTKTRAMVVRAERESLTGFTRGLDTLDIIEYSINAAATTVDAPDPRCDIFGALYMNFAPDAVAFSELLTYLLALFILSDLVRYQADQWARLLEDHPEEAILVERFLDSAGRKIPNLALNELQNDFFEFRLAA
jgi:YaaC-like Protein